MRLFVLIVLTASINVSFGQENVYYRNIVDALKNPLNVYKLYLNYKSIPEEVREFKNLRTLSLKEDNLTQLPKWIGDFKELERLSLNQTSISLLPPSISKLEKLRYVAINGQDFHYKSLSKIPGPLNLRIYYEVNFDSIQQLNNISSLYLDNCSLNGSSLFFSNKNLKTLTIDGGRIDSITFSNDMNNLQELIIKKCYLKALPSTIGNLRNLKKLMFSQNRVSLFPGIKVEDFDSEKEYIDSFMKLMPFRNSSKYSNAILSPSIKNLKKLEVLILERNRLKELPNEIGELVNLNTLIIKDSDKIPSSIGNLSNLETLEITCTKIPVEIGKLRNLKNLKIEKCKELPTSIGKLRNLINLKIDQCYITEIPSSIGKLKKLEKFYIDTKISHLPSSIGKLKNLKEFNLQTEIDTFPSSFGNLSHLEKLTIHWPSDTLFPRILRNLKNLRQFEVLSSEVPVGKLPGFIEELKLSSGDQANLEGIGNLINLTTLILNKHDSRRTKLTEIPQSIEKLNHLREISISSYSLKKVKLSGLKNLHNLNISSDSLKEVQISGLPNLKNLTLAGPIERFLIEDLDSLQELSITTNSLRSIQISDLQNLEDVKIKGRKLSSVSLIRLDSLRNLEIYSDSLKVLPDQRDVFENLEFLKIEGAIQSAYFHGLKNLKHIFITSSALDSVYGLDELTKLKKLGLIGWRVDFNPIDAGYYETTGNGKLTYLPPSIANLKNLEELYIKYNKIKAIPDGIGALKKLRILDASNNLIQQLPDSLCNLENLAELRLSFNNLKRLPKNIGNLKNLKVLIAQGNKIKSLPSSLFNLEKLEELYLTGNSLVSLPKIGNLNNLEEIDLRYNKLKSIPTSFGSIPYLNVIFLSNNNLSTLPSEVGNLKYLGGIDLRNNHLKTIPDSFGKLQYLGGLNLESNNLETLPETLCNLKNLTDLNIESNEIDSIPACLEDFPGLRR